MTVRINQSTARDDSLLMVLLSTTGEKASEMGEKGGHSTGGDDEE